MCKTYHIIGSLTTLKLSLEDNGIYDFKSLTEVINFQDSFPFLRQELITSHTELIEKEKIELSADLPELETAIELQKQQAEGKFLGEIEQLKQQLDFWINNDASNFFQRLRRSFFQWLLKIKIHRRESNFDLNVANSIRDSVKIHQFKNDRFQFITNHFDLAVKESAQKYVSEIDRKKSVIDSLNNYIFGALGEQKVVKVLETLSDDYYLINDFAISFSSAIYYRRDNEYIKSIQIDHILVSPSGVFIIETKNWSEQSLENESLFSPVQQIKRTSFALFKLLNNQNSNLNLNLNYHHWGEKKVSIKNLIVLINTRPKEEFQYVKIVTINELVGYINYFKPIFSNAETKGIAEFLLDINEQKTIDLQ